MCSRSKQDVEAAYRRGFKDGYDNAMEHSIVAFARGFWRRHQVKKLQRLISKRLEKTNA